MTWDRNSGYGITGLEVWDQVYGVNDMGLWVQD